MNHQSVLSRGGKKQADSLITAFFEDSGLKG